MMNEPIEKVQKYEMCGFTYYNYQDWEKHKEIHHFIETFAKALLEDKPPSQGSG